MIETNNNPLTTAQTEDLRQIREHAIVLAALLERYQFNPIVSETLDDIAHTAGRTLEARGVGDQGRGVSVTHKPNGHVVLEVEGDDQDFYTCPECDSDAVWMPVSGFLACRECGARWEEPE